MSYRGGLARYMARHSGNGGGSGAIWAFIITFILILIFTQNIFIAGFIAFLISAFFAVFGG